MSKRVLIVDATLLSAIQRCPWYFFITFVKNLRLNPKIHTPEYLENGDLGHKVLERYYTCIKEGLSKKESRAEALELGRDYYPTLNIDPQDAEWTLQTFSQYEDHYENDGIKILEVERPFLYDIYEDEELIVKMSGKIDIYAELPIIGPVPIDHKFRSRSSEEIVLTNQYINYSIAKSAEILYVNEIGMQKSYEPAKKFRRIPLTFNETLKKHWLKNTIQWIKRLDWHLQENNWPEIWNPFICKGCAVRTVCESGSEMDKHRKLATQFIEQEPWDVSKGLEGEKV